MISDKMVTSGVSKFKARSLFAIVGFLGCGIGLYSGSVVQSPSLNIIFLALSLGFAGLTYTAAWSSCQDLGGVHGGMIVSWMNTWANVGGFFAPIITAMLVNAYGWNNALTITSFIVIVGVVLWTLVKPDKPLPVE
jgi:ACS family glucarate transporter-like MFS transporter